MASVSIGRSRLPPEEIRWLATSGIMATSEPVRARMVALTRSMSARDQFGQADRSRRRAGFQRERRRPK